MAVTGAYASAEWVRFITPVTDPAHRLRGYFGATVVIAARTGASAEGTYDRLGFQPIGEQHAPIALP